MALPDKIGFSHYLLTRFNLPLSSRPEGNTVDVLGDAYLSYRFKLFESTCLPSVRNQSNQNFKWLILFDINTPDTYKRKAEEWHNTYSNLIPCYLDTNRYGGLPLNREKGYDIDTDCAMLDITQRFVADVISTLEDFPKEWRLTTRLDSDDALHYDLIDTIQKAFSDNPGNAAYDFVYTYKYVPKERICYRYSLINGHYITLAELTEKTTRSVLFCNHLEMDQYVPVYHFYSRPRQLELIHGENVVNGYTDLTLSGLLYAIFHFRGKDFALDAVRYSRIKALIMIGSLIKQSLLKSWRR